VTNHEYDLTAALAAADRELAHVKLALASVVEEARELLATHSDTETWAILGDRLVKRLDCGSRYQQFAAEMLAAAAVQLAAGTVVGKSMTRRHTEPSPVYAYGCADCPYKETEDEAVERSWGPCPECGGPMLSRE
jgi:hypothetical protein